MNQNMEQAKRFFDLQFHSEEPGAESGTPPAMGSETQGSQNAGTLGQAVTSSGGTNQSTNNQPQVVDWNTHQAAIKGMNEAQRIKAEWEKTAKEYGFNSVEDAKQAFQTYKVLNENPIALAKEYFSQRPDDLAALLRENPMQAAQLFGQVFDNGQVPNTDPYAKYGDIDNIPDLVKAIEADTAIKFEKMIENKLGPVVQPIQQQFQTQYEERIKTRENARIPEGVQQAVWDKVREIGVPFNLIEKQPWLIDGLIIEASGGLDKYGENLKNSGITNYKQQVQSNAQSTAQLTPVGGIPAVDGNEPIMNADKLNQKAHEMLNAVLNSQKT